MLPAASIPRRADRDEQPLLRRDGAPRAPMQWALADDLFIIPDGDEYVLYAPLHGGIALGNGATVKLLQDVGRGAQRVDPSSAVFRELIEAGIVVRAGSSRPSPLAPNVDAAFDPSGVSLFLTTKCSMRCTYCYASAGDRATAMSWELAKAAIDWLADHTRQRGRNRFYVMFHGGGEVTIASSVLKQSVEYVRNLSASEGFAVSIEAGLNGAMSVPMTEWVIANLDGTTISLDGLPEVHNRQRPLANGLDSFDLVARTLRRMDEVRFRYGIRMTVTSESIAKLPESIQYICDHFAAPVIQAEPVFQVGRAATGGIPSADPARFIDAFRTARRIARARGRELKYSGAKLGVSSTFCRVASDSFAVTSEGLVSSCYEVENAEDPRALLFVYGKFDPELNTFVFDQDKIRRLRTLSVQHKPHCQSCFCKWHCAGDCSAKLAALGDAWDASNSPRCHVNRELTKDLIREQLPTKSTQPDGAA